MRTPPLVALLVVATAICTVTVFGQSAPTAPAAPPKKARVARLEQRPAATSAVPAWLATPAAPAPTPTPGRHVEANDLRAARAASR